MIKSNMPTALVVDDDEQICKLITTLLKMEKIATVSCFNAKDAMDTIRENKYIDLMIIDYFLPDNKGTEVIEFGKRYRSNTPIIVVSGSSDDIKLASLVAGANMVIGKPFSEVEFLMIVRNLISLSDAYDRLKDAESIIEALGSALEARDSYTEGHGNRVANMSVELYDALGLNDRNQRESLYIGGILHDIGKIGVPDSILKSPNRLTPEEFELVKKHPVEGHQICSNLAGINKDALDVIMYHHERINGSGYPVGLDDGAIPMLAQIVAIADVYDALTSRRSYRDEMNQEVALVELEKDGQSGKLNKEFLAVFKKLITEKD